METGVTTTTTELIETGEKHDVRGRRLTPNERRAELLAAFRSSGLTQAAFARREGLTYSTFCTWAQAERAAGRLPTKPGGVVLSPAAKPASVRFVEACMPEPLHGAVAMASRWEVRLADGTVVTGTSATELATLVRALRS